MTQTFTQFATDSQPSIFTSLGIDWQMLVLQIVAFLLLVLILGKYVYPWLMKSVDERQAKIDDAQKAAADAQKSAVDAEERVEALLKEAQVQAADIVATAKAESAATLSATEAKAKTRADQIVADAKDDIAKEVVAAKVALHNETIELVALATERVVGKVMTKSLDDEVIRGALKAVK